MNLNLNLPPELQILTGAGVVAVLCLLASLICLVKHRKSRLLVTAGQEQIEELQSTVKRLKETIDVNAEHVAEMSRRLVWLDTRIRRPKLAAEEVVDDSSEAPKLNITERRHRVVTLAARGQSTEAIATTIGMMPGEVELILSLDQAARSGR
ncbi:MAG: hypothetical protein ABL999_04765 [Pyrinomonadaceae bacterium]